MLTFDQGANRFNYRTAGICIHENHVLLHRLEKDNEWFFPGGRVEMLEHSHDALEREMVEEMGTTIKILDLLWFMETFYQDEERQFHELGLYYSFSLPESFQHFDKIKSFYGTDPDKVLIFKWFPLATIEADFPLYPIYFRKAIHRLPAETVHVIHHE